MDLWMVDHTKGSYFGMTGHWIEVKADTWRLRAEVMVFHGILGNHTGSNLGYYFVALAQHVGIISDKEVKVSQSLITNTSTNNSLQLYAITCDNASNNDTTTETVETELEKQVLFWSSDENQLPYIISPLLVFSVDQVDRCFEHVVNIGNIAIMGHITRLLLQRRQLPYGNMTLSFLQTGSLVARSMRLWPSEPWLSRFISFLFHLNQNNLSPPTIRSNAQVNKSNTSKNFKRPLHPSSSFYTATCTGKVQLIC